MRRLQNWDHFSTNLNENEPGSAPGLPRAFGEKGGLVCLRPQPEVKQ